MPDKKSISARLDKLSEQFEKLKSQVNKGSYEHAQGNEDSDSEMHYCSIPEQPQRAFGPEVSAERVAAIMDLGKKWVNRTNLHYYFFNRGSFGGADSQQDVVREAFEVWKDVGIGLTFTEVSVSSESELRIGFKRGSSWSVIGTDALDVGQQERTMNFGWNLNVSGPNGLDTAIHEIGHAIGFHHEHQNPNAGIVWNRQAVYDYFERTQNPPWSHATTDFNILDKLDPSSVDGTDWDPDSIMHYAFDQGLIQQPERFRNGLRPAPGLSAKDIEVVKRFYPEAPTVDPELVPWESQRLSLTAGEQKDFNVIPDQTRDYDFRTFGQSDTVMVLFEQENGGFRYVQGDDDSGFDRNASFRVRLVRGRKYQLRIRLYYSYSGGDTAVMMW